MTQGVRDVQSLEPLIEINAVTKVFSARQTETVALRETSLTIGRGELVCIVGPSGCGKPCARIISADILRPWCGGCGAGGRVVTVLGRVGGGVFQGGGLFGGLTARRTVEFGPRVAGVPADERRRRALDALTLTGMAKFADRYPNELSGGMRQRVGIARAMVNDPEVLLMDEPFAALDAQTRELMQLELLSVWEKTKKTIVFVTHSVSEAVLLADRIVIMSANPGRVRDIVTVDVPRPRDDTTAAFNALERELRDALLHEVRQAATSAAPIPA